MRRVVTGINSEGQSCVLLDEEVVPRDEYTTMVWECDPGPLLDRLAGIDPEQVPAIEPPRHGSRLAVRNWPPIAKYLERVAKRNMPGFGPKGEHVTRTVDYIYVLEGELWLDLEAESVCLKPGDFVVQLATMHAWRSETGARTIGCMIDILPPHMERAPGPRRGT